MDDDEIIEAPILQTMISDGTSIFPVDTVLYQEKYWLVRGWMQSGDGKWKKPARLIALENFQFQDLRNTNQRMDFSVGIPLPKFFFEREIPQAEAAKYVLVEKPPIRFRNIPNAPRTIH